MRYEIALRILGDELNPEEVTDLLEIIPDYKAKKGEKRGNLSTKYTIGVWAKIFEEDSKDFLGSLLFHAKQMEKYEKEFKMLCDAGNRVQFYCGVWYE